MLDPLPIFILAGSDSSPDTVPPGVHPSDVLAGPKGRILLRTGRCLVAELVDRIRASGRFGEPLLVGPRQWYSGLVDCEILSVQGTLVDTLRQLADAVRHRLPPEQPFAVTSCDILPSASSFRQLLDEDYRSHDDALFWWQMVQAAPQQMGAAQWKPAYRLPVQPGGQPLNLYPGHLVITRAEGLRFTLINRLLQLAYRYRNRLLENRYLGITLGALGTLITHDIRNLARFQLPVLTLAIPFYGLRGYFKYRRSTAALQHVEQFLSKTFLHRSYHRAAGGRPVVISVTRQLAFAKDIDTQAELRELDCGPGNCA
jgi:hypothetical protein